MTAGARRVVDVHAHFFNASDVPVRGFVAECLGHRAPRAVQVLLEALSPIADVLAAQAPTAAQELHRFVTCSKRRRERCPPTSILPRS